MEMIAPEVEMTGHQALEELHELLRTCCHDRVPPRYVPNRYQVCRTALITGELRSLLPGFLTQCPSSMKFRDFIHLYDRDPEKRMTFVYRALDDCWAELNVQPAHTRPAQNTAKPRSGERPGHPQINRDERTAFMSASEVSDDFMAEAEFRSDGPFWDDAVRSETSW